MLNLEDGRFKNGADPREAKWLTIKVTRKTALWVLSEGEPFSKIAILELFSTLLWGLALTPPMKEARNEVLTLSTGTDNLGNTMAVSKLMATKLPLCAAMMQLASTLAVNQWRLKLGWIPRNQNFEADELSNGLTHRFRSSYEVMVEPLLGKLTIFNKMIKYGQKLYDDIKTNKVVRKEERGKNPRSEKGRRQEERGTGGRPARRPRRS